MRLKKAPWGLRWSLAGALLGVVSSLLMHAPASWLARALDRYTEGRLLLADARGSIWSGSALLVLTAGRGSRDSAALPDRIRWTATLSGAGPGLQLQQECCLNGPVRLRLKPGLDGTRLTLESKGEGWIARWPTAWLGGLGTPWNTLQLGGSIRVGAEQLSLDWVSGAWRQSGRLALDFVNLSSRVSTVDPLGTYRLTVSGDPTLPGVSRLHLSTQQGALLLSGEGSLDHGKARFLGVARAAEGREAALDNLLNIIGRRQGATSAISIG